MTTSPEDRYFPEWTIADRLRRVRRDTGLTQDAFAERLQVGAQRYSAWESGRNHPPARDLVAIAKRIELAFKVAAEWTLGLEMRNTPRPDGPEGVDQYAIADSNREPAGSEHSRADLRLLSGAA